MLINMNWNLEGNVRTVLDKEKISKIVFRVTTGISQLNFVFVNRVCQFNLI